MYNRQYLKILFLLFSILASGCRFEQLDNKKEINKEIERQTVKRFTEKQIMQEAVRVGDSLSFLADSLALVKAAVPEKSTEYSPENEPRVQAIARHYQITPKRLPVSAATTKPAKVKMLSQTELLYTRPGTAAPGEKAYLWQFPIQRRVVLESLTLKRGKSQRIRHLFTKPK